MLSSVSKRTPRHFSGFEQRDILFGDADTFGKFSRAHFALGQHHIQIDDDRHGLDELPVFFGHAPGLDEHLSDHPDQAAEEKQDTRRSTKSKSPVADFHLRDAS